MKEIWKDIEGYEGLYQVSNKGRVKSVERYVEKKAYGKTYRILKKESIKKGHRVNKRYTIYDLYKNNECNSFLIHRLVAKAFIPNPNKYTVVHHKDEDPKNNVVENLEWISEKSHIELHANERSKTIYQYNKDTMELVGVWAKAKDASKECGIDESNINRCCNNKGYKSAGGFVWSYEFNRNC